MINPQPCPYLSKIAVDLTSILPGGDNGGAKIFVLALIKQLAFMNPQTQFILLTQSAAHQELNHSMQHCTNIQCMSVVTTTKKLTLPLWAKKLFRLQYIAHTRSLIKYFFYWLYALVQYPKKRNVLRTIKASGPLAVDLLFCPMTAPTYATRHIPVVCIVHDLQFKTYPHFFDELALFHRDYVFLRACQKASALIAISNYTHQSIIKNRPSVASKITTITLAAQIPAETSADPIFLSQIGIEAQSYILYPANPWKHKNHEMLLVAFQKFHRQHANERPLKLVCTGAPGQKQQWLERAALEMGLADQVLFLGYVPTQHLQELMRHATGLIFPSLYEGFGLPIIEAMAVGVPVACSDCTAMPEIAAEAALLFSPSTPDHIYQALYTLVFDETRRQQLIQLGKQRAPMFSDLAHIAQQYWRVFNRVGSVNDRLSIRR